LKNKRNFKNFEDGGQGSEFLYVINHDLKNELETQKSKGKFANINFKDDDDLKDLGKKLAEAMEEKCKEERVTWIFIQMNAKEIVSEVANKYPIQAAAANAANDSEEISSSSILHTI